MKTIEVLGPLSSTQVRGVVAQLRERAALLRQEADKLAGHLSGVADNMRSIAHGYEASADEMAEASRQEPADKECA